MLNLNLIKEIKSFSKEINVNKNTDWKFLSYNPAAFHLLEKNPDKVYWTYFSENTGVPLDYYIKNQDKIDWRTFSRNKFYKNFIFEIDWEYLAQSPYICIESEKILEYKGYWDQLSTNPAAIYLLEKNLDKINWSLLSQNLAAVHLLEKNPDKVNWNVACSNYAMPIKTVSWGFLSSNFAALEFLEKNLDNVVWDIFSINSAASKVLEKNLDKVNWKSLSINPSVIHLLEEEY